MSARLDSLISSESGGASTDGMVPSDAATDDLFLGSREHRSTVQGHAVESLTGTDTNTEKEIPSYAQSLTFAADGRLWLGNTGQGSQRWDPKTDRRESWPLEVSGPLAIRPDGKVWQIGPTYTEPDPPNRIPLDSRPNPRFPLQLLDVENQAIIRTIPDPVEGGSRLLAWTVAPKGSHVAASLLDSQGKQQLLLWNADTGKLLHRIASESSPVSPALPGPGLAFAPDASLIATWDGSGRVDLWSVADGQDCRELPNAERPALRRLRRESLVPRGAAHPGRAMDDRRGWRSTD